MRTKLEEMKDIHLYQTVVSLRCLLYTSTGRKAKTKTTDNKQPRRVGCRKTGFQKQSGQA